MIEEETESSAIRADSSRSSSSQTSSQRRRAPQTPSRQAISGAAPSRSISTRLLPRWGRRRVVQWCRLPEAARRRRRAISTPSSTRCGRARRNIGRWPKRPNYMSADDSGLRMVRCADGLADLEEAARVPALRFPAAARLGREYVTRGHAHAGIEWFERAAAVPAPSREAGLAVLYELGVALDGIGERARALAVLMEIESDEPDYRDVRAASRASSGGRRASDEDDPAAPDRLLRRSRARPGGGSVVAVLGPELLRRRAADASRRDHERYVRGAICGLGLVNLVAAASELRSLLAARRLADRFAIRRPHLEDDRCAR